jgi:hypothetical protein
MRDHLIDIQSLASLPFGQDLQSGGVKLALFLLSSTTAFSQYLQCRLNARVIGSAKKLISDERSRMGDDTIEACRVSTSLGNTGEVSRTTPGFAYAYRIRKPRMPIGDTDTWTQIGGCQLRTLPLVIPFMQFHMKSHAVIKGTLTVSGRGS